ncbi:hypothetical protein J2W22_001992 [Sphingomonas kyeonggiensis]|nr:hypothetical protein [Sphingomonas kyeonggiensis]
MHGGCAASVALPLRCTMFAVLGAEKPALGVYFVSFAESPQPGSVGTQRQPQTQHFTTGAR